MSLVRPFKAVRPAPELADKVASLPYDVMNREEAKALARGNKYSFLHVGRAEIDLPDDVDDYAPEVYQKGKENFEKMIEDGVLIQEEKPCFYIYRQIMDGRAQTGLVATVSVDEYKTNDIKKHEFTREDKEQDRIRHFDVCDANTEPIFLTYRKEKDISKLIDDFVESHDPVYNFTGDDGVTHILWVLDDEAIIDGLVNAFGKLDALYIADGHHRSASAAKVAERRRQQYPDAPKDAEFNFFMAVIFPDEDLYIMEINRLLHDLNGMTKDEFLDKLGKIFNVEKSDKIARPEKRGEYGMYLDGQWYRLEAPAELSEGKDPVERLDVSLLQNYVLEPLFGIENPRTDPRIEFPGGIRGMEELERRVDDDCAVAFAVYPTTLADLLAIADAELIMPPKSTWFEPKLASGLFIHKLSD